MVVNSDIINRIEQDFMSELPFFGELRRTIEEKLASLTGMEVLFMKYLYAYMPLSDAGAYDFEVFYGFAEQAAYLAVNGPYADKVPQEYFFNYILSHRINSEDITDCRKFFYNMVEDRVKGMKMYEAVLELNNWCCEQATYRSTSERTASPVTVYKGGFGRCGEESTFLVTVLRSVGIPARQVYVPRWSHCDSNHAWVEAWCDGSWYFTGACEPKPVLNNGWFTYAASRAVLEQSRLFTGFGYEREEVVQKDGNVTLINNSGLYSEGKYLTVKVKDMNGDPVKEALVRFEIVNSAEFFPAAVLKTGVDGTVRIRLGKGEVHLHVLKNGCEAMQTINVKETDEVTVILGRENLRKYDEWLDYRILAAESANINNTQPSPEQEKEQEERNKKGDLLRKNRIEGYFDADYAKYYQAYPDIVNALENAKGNFGELRAFLDKTYHGVTLGDKEALLRYISQKDCRDIRLEVLEDQLDALQYKKNYPKDVFEQYVLSPRIYIEMLTPFRAFIKNYFRDRAFNPVENPEQLWKMIDREITYYPDKEYTTILATPKSALTLKAGTPMAKKVLFTAVCRTYGLAARLDEIYQEPQYWKKGTFVFVDEEYEKKAVLTLVSEENPLPGYDQQFTVGRKTKDGVYETLGLWQKEFIDRKLTLTLAPGEYRVLTCDRTESGSILGKQLYIHLQEGDRKSYALKCGTLAVKDLIKPALLPEFSLKDQAGRPVTSKELLGGKKNILVFADPGKEPTEHVFNELLEIRKMSGEPECGLHFIIKDENSLKDDTLCKIRKAFSDAKYWYDDFTGNTQILGKAFETDTDRLPLILVTDGSSKGLYACSGYNVGCIDLIMKILFESM